MGNIFRLKPHLNKANGQVSFYIPRKKMTKDMKKHINLNSTLKFKFEGADK